MLVCLFVSTWFEEMGIFKNQLTTRLFQKEFGVLLVSFPFYFRVGVFRNTIAVCSRQHIN